MVAATAVLGGCGLVPDKLKPGTAVTLTAQTADGGRPTSETMQTAQRIIEKRAKGLGLDGTSVEVQGNALVITVPGDDGSRAKALARTAHLTIRPVLTASTPARSGVTVAKEVRQSNDPSVQASTMASIACTHPDPLHGGDDPRLPLVTCDSEGKEVFVLSKSSVDGGGIEKAEAVLDSASAQHMVLINFTPEAAELMRRLTTEYLYQRIAISLDSEVLSAPVVQAMITGNQIQISGRFTEDSAAQLANALRFGALPVSFTS
ncbi:hypothetical protein LTV02_34280 [Nocardia yamanashiensis]|uniref:preprotein translocase subunit SecD n=1 Tax=Nocardia yamanashiensis TaxID=209247 RepID=UPI001E6323DC|nr:hypothetical protein [Nocardia yamanashiensis]UGT40983.1 hypothetical protein LTV02_34280 [Nocardia yamanashiensis]